MPIDTAAHTTLLSGFCILDGYNILFSDAQLDALYPSHHEYVRRVRAEADRLVDERFWLDPDADLAVDQAKRADVP